MEPSMEVVRAYVQGYTVTCATIRGDIHIFSSLNGKLSDDDLAITAERLAKQWVDGFMAELSLQDFFNKVFNKEE